MGGIPNTMPEL